MRGLAGVVLAVAGSVLASTSVAAGEPLVLRMVDDLQQTISEPLHVCFVRGLTSTCFDRSGPVEAPASFESVSIEGDRHGPLRLRSSEIDRSAGTVTLTVLRKARLEVSGEGQGEDIVVSLYRPEDPNFETPVVRVPTTIGKGIWIPAGAYLASMSRRGDAPDLRMISASPGARVELRYERRPGWSLVLRLRDVGTGEAVQGARVSLRLLDELVGVHEAELRGGGASEWGASSDRFGLATVSGLPPAILEATIAHDGYLARSVGGLFGTAGSFAFREAALERGGTVRIEVSLDGSPAVGAKCRVVDYPEGPVGPDNPPTILFEARAGPDGACRSRPLPQGVHTVQVRPATETGRVDQIVEVANGRETAVTFALERFSIEGRVRRGEEPVQGYRLAVSRLDPAGRNPPREYLAEARTDAQGEYSLRVFEAGEYMVVASTPNGTPAASRLVGVVTERTEVDFSFGEAELTGRVVDQEGSPVAAATVVLDWQGGSHRIARSDATGSFSFMLEGSGHASLSARREGFLPSAAMEVEVQEGRAAPPVELQLRRMPTVKGTLLAASGVPVSGGWLYSFDRAPGGLLMSVAEARTDGNGRFEIAAGREITRVFATGRECPLSSWDLSSSATRGDEHQELVCEGSPSALELRLLQSDGSPLQQARLRLVRDGVLIPDRVLDGHLARLGVGSVSDGYGQFVAPGLAPGSYAVYLWQESSELSIAMHEPAGYLATINVAPQAVAEVEIAVDSEAF